MEKEIADTTIDEFGEYDYVCIVAENILLYTT